jgi:hypothetical protein
MGGWGVYVEAGWLAKVFEGAWVEVMIVDTSGSEGDTIAVKLTSALQIFLAVAFLQRTCQKFRLN